MIKNIKLIFGVFLLVGLFGSLVSAEIQTYARSEPQYSAGFSVGESENLGGDMCSQGQDFLLQIAPFGCLPSVVRSDLLEEQNVPVFCPIVATKINPLIDVNIITGVSFSGNYPPEVGSVRFHPANEALGGKKVFSSTLGETIGYAVITLNKQPSEKDMPDWVEGNIVAQIRYSSDSAYGTGTTAFYLPQMDDETWERDYTKYGFWSGKGFLRVEEIMDNSVKVGVYTDAFTKISSVNLERGTTSKEISLPGFYCSAGIKLELSSFESPVRKVKLRVGDGVGEYAEKERFLDNKCRVVNIFKQGIVEAVTISCNEGSGTKSFVLRNLPDLRLEVNGNVGTYEIGDKLKKDGEKNIYLVYIKGVDEKNMDYWILSTSKDYGINLNGVQLQEIELIFENGKQKESFDGGDFIKLDGNNLGIGVKGFVESILEDNVDMDYFDKAIAGYRERGNGDGAQGESLVLCGKSTRKVDQPERFL